MDSVGGYVFSSPDQLKDLFIAQMRNFANTITEHENPESIMLFAAPYLSMAGMQDIIGRLSATVLANGLNEAAHAVEIAREKSGVLFGYAIDETLYIVAFDLMTGSVSRNESSIADLHTNIAAKTFREVLIMSSLDEAAKQLDMIPLKDLTLNLI